MPHKLTPVPTKYCENCGKPLFRKRYNGRLEDRTVFLKRRYCNLICMGKAKTIKTSGVRINRQYRKATCEKCGTTKNLHLHHIDLNPKNNDPANHMTLCGSCHTRWHWQNGKTVPKQSPPCKICGQKSRRSGMCQKHYQRYKQYGSPYLTKRNIGGKYRLIVDE